MHIPDFEAFQQYARQGNLIPVYREVLADLDTPVSSFSKLDNGPYGFLLESVTGGEKWARYSFLGTKPRIICEGRGRRIVVRRTDNGKREEFEDDPLAVMRQIMSRYRPVRLPGLPRFFGGAVGYFAYDLIRQIEDIPQRVEDDLGVPDMMFMITDTLVIFDNISAKIKVVALAHLDGEMSLREAYEDAVDRGEETIAAVTQGTPPRELRALGSLPPARNEETPFQSNFTPEDFKAAVTRARDLVLGGDAIQVVLSQRLQVDTDVSALDLYRCLRTVNPSPYMFYLKFGDLCISGASPEVLVRLEDGRVEERPIAGTRRRGSDPEEDEALGREMLDDPKECAEHIMLVDLSRNDVGRVSRIGSVHVNELKVIERYSHVQHIVSNVRGELAPGYDCFDVLEACFPAGTVTGAPKVRAMEIIDELEPSPRGVYAGAAGYIDFDGNMDTAIAIRTAVVKGQTVYFQVGAGIVADSDPDFEYEETINKARAMLRALAMAGAGE